MSRFPKLALAACLVAATPALADYGLGRTALPEEIAAWDIDVRPDGAGLPEGSGDVWTGEEIFAEKCAVCHGDFGEAVGRWPQLAGGHNTLTDLRPVKTIGSYWPYLSTVWDYVNRAMPFGDAQSLTADEVYAITAYLLYVNDVVDDDFTLSHDNFVEVELPNVGNFYPDDRAEVEIPDFTREVCMENCKEAVTVSMRAAVLDVTPEETKARKLREAVARVQNPVAKPTELVVNETPEAAPASIAAPDPELVAAGEKVFRKCKACHQVGDKAKNRSGPVLNGIVGGAAGQVDGFRYSKALEGAGADGLVWDAAALDAFLTKPKDYLKGTKMSFSGLRDEADRKAIIAYLSTFGGGS